MALFTILLLLVIFCWLFIFFDVMLKRTRMEVNQAFLEEAKKWHTEDRSQQGWVSKAFGYYFYSAWLWPIPSFAICLLTAFLLMLVWLIYG